MSILVRRKNAVQPTDDLNPRTTSLVQALKVLFGELTGSDLDNAAAGATFFDLGFDSLVLTQASQSIQSRFGVKVTFRQMMESLSSLELLAAHLDRQLPPEAFAVPGGSPTPTASARNVEPAIVATEPAPAAPVTAPTPASPGEPVLLTGDSPLERVVKQQLQLMARQLELLRRTAPSVSAPGALPLAAIPAAATPLPRAARPVVKAVKGDDDARRFGPFKPIAKEAAGGLTPRQQKALDALTARYNRRTAGSKRLAQEHRTHYCDPRAAGNFRQLWKEMVYPIVCARSLGSRIWDVDGNEYVDVTMGFGANYLGHSPDFVMAALEEQMKRGVEIGPQSPLAGENARLICELTGMERATFCNTGSEAVMAALRVARTVTGRDRFVFFRGDYHGVFDEVLARPALVDDLPGAMPIAPGVPHLANVIVLDYGKPASLEAIRNQAGTIAAVLVEPVQARHPDLQPRQFLHDLRRLTGELGIALIFDEVITGFRVAPGGAQGFFGVRADLATYGKVVGGGMPIGVLAGQAKFMDALDGGSWRYGDTSFPEVGVTFFAGTFVRHPLAMAAANAVLKRLKAAGPSLQQAVNERTARLADQVNRLFGERELPMRLQPFSALFYYDFHPDLHHAGLLFYYLRDRGVHIWEGRVCHLSAAHTDADVEFVTRAFAESLDEMQAAGFLPEKVGAGVPLESPAPPVAPPETAPAIRESAPALAEREPPSRESPSPLSPNVSTGPLPDRFPLTEGQMEMWLAAQVSPEAAGPHHGTNVIRLEGHLDVSALRRAVAEVIQRHEAFRCTFTPDGSEIVVTPSLAYEMPVHDLSSLPASERTARTNRILEEEGRRILDLAHGPLFSFQLIQLSPGEHLLVFTVQMIICDGWAYTLVLEDLGALYSAYVEGRQPKLPPRLPLRDYVRWQEAQQRPGAAAKSLEEFWLSQFQTVPPPLDLPLFRPRPAARTFAGSRQSLRLSAGFYQAVKRVARELQNTPFTLLLTAYQTWLHRLSGQNDFVVGVPFAGQGGAGLDSLVGQCVQTLPLRTRVDADESFVTLLRKTRSHLLDAHEHWNYSFGKLIQKLDLPRDASRIPLVSAIFNLDVPLSTAQFTGCKRDITAGPRFYYQYDLGFNLVDEGSTLLVECDYNSNLFDAETIRGWLNHFQTLLGGVVENPECPLARLPLLDKTELQRLLLDRNDTRCQLPDGATVHGLIADQAARTPDAIAVEWGGKQWTYSTLDTRANQLANALRNLGVGPDGLVGICTERSFDMLVAILGTLKAGGAYVPIDPDLPRERMSTILEDAAVVVLLTHSALLPRLPETRARLVCLDEDREVLLKENAAPPAAGVGPANLAYVIYTSGSTGRPKGVEITHGAVVNFLWSMQRAPGLKADDVVLALTTLSFDIAVLELLLPLTVGARTVIVTREVLTDPALLGDTLRGCGVTVMQATPITWRMLLDAGWTGNPRLKVLCGGEAMGSDLAARLLERCAELWNMYGPTETTVWSMACRVKPGEAVTLGHPIANTQVYVADDHLQPVPVGVPGELLISGAGLARGYRHRPDLTSGKFVASPFGDPRWQRLYRTGDLARYRTDGDIEFIGRRDHQVKMRGYRIELGEIESVLLGHPDVRGAVVLLREDTPGQPRLVAYVVSHRVPAEGNGANAGALRAELRQLARAKLPAYMVPGACVLLGSLPRTLEGKTDRRALPPPSPDDLQVSEDSVAPRTELEQRLARLWMETLKFDKVGVRDNFFDLGGQSLLAVSLFLRIESELGRKLPLATLFRAPTIEQLARALSSEQVTAAEWDSLVPIQPKGSRPPLFLVHGAGGNVLLYRCLADYLAPDCPLYGLQSRGLDGHSPPLKTIEEMAVAYLQELRLVQPHGPYYLGGYCLGGTVAYEMAQQLLQAGEQVALVAMLDTYNFIRALKSSFLGFIWEKAKFHLGNLTHLRPRDMARYLMEKVRIARDGELANLMTSKPGSTVEPGVARAVNGVEARVQAVNDYAADHYEPRPYPGRLTLFKPHVNYKFYPDPNMGWGDLALGGLDIVELPFNPHAMLVEPYVRQLAAELRVRLGNQPSPTPPAGKRPSQVDVAPLSQRSESPAVLAS